MDLSNRPSAEQLEPRLLLSANLVEWDLGGNADYFANTLETATQLSLNDNGSGLVEGSINSAPDVDILKFNATQTGKMRLAMKSTDQASNLVSALVILDSQGNLVASDIQDPNAKSARLKFDVQAGQTYYVEARSLNDTAGKYKIRFSTRATGGNLAPVATNDFVQTSDNTPVVLDVLANDTDPEGDLLEIVGFTPPMHGNVADNGDGTLTYTPYTDYVGGDFFAYTISDGNNNVSIASVIVTVIDGNDAPVAQNDIASTNENTPVRIAVLANDSDPDGDMLEVVDFSKPINGELIDNGDGSLTYTPEDGFVGQDLFAYTIDDGNNNQALATVIVTVNDVNGAPVALNDAAITDEDSSVVIDLLANDSDPDGDTISISGFGQPQHGQVVDNGDGTVVYTPEDGYFGQDSFSYTISDGNGNEATASVEITVNEVNAAPIVQNDFVVTDENVSVIINVLENDSDPDGDELSITGFTQPEHCYVTDNGDGTLTYTATDSYNGPDSFTYTVSDGNGGEATATVNIIVNPVNDAPTASFTADAVSGDAPLRVNFDSSGSSDPDGDALNCTWDFGDGATASGINVTHIYQNSGDYVVTLTVDDGNGGVDTASLNVAVTAPASDELPAGWNQSDVGSVGIAGNATFANGTFSLEGSGADIWGRSDEFFFVYQQLSGDAEIIGRVISVEQTSSYAKSGIMIRDSLAANAAHAFVLVHPSQGVAMHYRSYNGDYTRDVGTTGTAPEWVRLVRQGNTITAYNSNDGANWNFISSKTVTMGSDIYVGLVACSHNDSQLSTGVIDGVSVNGQQLVNNPPTANNDSTVTNKGEPVTINILANDSDPEGDTLSIASYQQPANGAITDNGNGTLTYTPAAGFEGLDSFSYTITDGNENEATAQVDISVFPPNDAPIAQGDSAVTDEDYAVDIDVLANDSDANGDTIDIISFTQPSNGTVSENGGILSYTPDADFSGSDSFSYTVSDGRGGEASASVDVTVNPVNDAPEAVDDSVATIENSPAIINILANDSDADGEVISLAAYSQPANGLVSDNGDGTLTYTPDADYKGYDDFTYTIIDESGAESTATVHLTVKADIGDEANPLGGVYFIDRDGDGFGVASPNGPDADDTDASVNTWATVEAKYGDLETFVRYLGYNPKQIIVTNIGGGYGSLQPGDMVVFRAGTVVDKYTFGCSNLHGTAENPIVFMAMPGEKVIFDATGQGIGCDYSSNIIFDGFIVRNTYGYQSKGLGMYESSNITWRNIESTGHSRGMFSMQNLHGITVEYSVFRNNGSHGIYWGARDLPNSDLTVRGVLSYNNGRHGFQHNGRVENLTVEGSVFHSNSLGGVSFIEGVHHSTIRGNLIFNNNKQGIILYVYNDPSPAIQPFDTNYNTIEDNIVWVGKYSWNGSTAPDYHAGIQVNNAANSSLDLGHNTFRNNIVVTYIGPSFLFSQSSYASTTTIEGNQFYRIAGESGAFVYGSSSLDLDGFESLSSTISNNFYGDPNFVDVSIDYYLTPEKFNFNIAS